MKTRQWIGMFLFFGLLGSCNYLDVDPVGKVIPEKTSEFRALMTSAYGVFPSHKKLLSVRADELFPEMYTPTYSSYIDLALLNDAGADPDAVTYPWGDFYKTLFYANSVIKDVETAIPDNPEDPWEQLKGEALLLRAYTHFELLNLYARPYQATSAATDRGIPLSLTVDIAQEYVPQSVEEVYGQILADVEAGRALLKVENQPAATRYRFSRKSAAALEARVRLYRNEWELALAAAEELLPDCPLEDLNEEGAKAPYAYDSREAILSLELTSGTDLADDATVLPELAGKYDPEGDLRPGVYFSYSSYLEVYRANKCYNKSMRVSFRSGEIYLIAAEAAAHIPGKEALARQRLKELLQHRLTPDYYVRKAAQLDAMNAGELIAEIADERARELALEGHRWYDLRRTTRPEIIKNYMDTNFDFRTLIIEQNDPRYVIPFPREATENNPNLK